jgi:hypothetical protein
LFSTRNTGSVHSIQTFGLFLIGLRAQKDGYHMELNVDYKKRSQEFPRQFSQGLQGVKLLDLTSACICASNVSFGNIMYGFPTFQ